MVRPWTWIREKVTGASIGCIHNFQPCWPASVNEADAAAAERLDIYWNWAFPDPQYRGEYPSLMRAAVDPHIQPGDMARICRPVDWLGLNHYSPVYVRAEPNSILGFAFGEKPEGVPLTPIGWPINPDAFRDTLRTVHGKYGLPIYVLENGYGNYDKPDEAGAITDQERIEFLRAYIGAMNSAAASGADIRGYFVWSLLDNFEWESGYSIRFGLTYVDYKSLKRFPKTSFHWYKDLIKAARQQMKSVSSE